MTEIESSEVWRGPPEPAVDVRAARDGDGVALRHGVLDRAADARADLEPGPRVDAHERAPRTDDLHLLEGQGPLVVAGPAREQVWPEVGAPRQGPAADTRRQVGELEEGHGAPGPLVLACVEINQ